MRVTDDYLRAYYLRPEVHPVEESGPGEQALHAALMADPRRGVTQREIDAVEDADARDNYRVVLGFRDRLVQAGTVQTLEGAKVNLGGTPSAPTVNGAQVLCGNVPTKNATVFVISSVLTPPAT